jgi:gliding motility-associated-like protein
MKYLLLYCPFIVALTFLWPTVTLHAQTCNGVTGAESWHTGMKELRPGTMLPAGHTGYQFTAANCPTEGYYTIADNIGSCFNGDWHTIQKNDALGNIMIVNAALSPGIVYTDTVNDLCGNTSYSFEVLTENISATSSCNGHPIKPQLSLVVETMGGNVLGTYYTGNMELNRGYVYNCPFWLEDGQSAVRVKVYDLAAGGCGNDFIIDNLTILPCGPTVEADIVNALSTEVTVCKGSNQAIDFSSKIGEGYNRPACQWQRFDGTKWVDIPGATSTGYVHQNNSDTGRFRYRLAVGEGNNISQVSCRVISNEVVVNVRDADIQATVSGNSPVCINSELSLTASGGITYSWQGPGGFSSAIASPSLITNKQSGGIYTVSIGDGNGCEITDSITIRLLPFPAIVVSSPQHICTGNTVQLTAGGGSIYAWVPANTLSDASVANPIAMPIQTTTYLVTVTDTNHCSDTASVLVAVHDKPAVHAGDDKAVIKNNSVRLDGSITDSLDVNYYWSPAASLNNAGTLTPLASPVVNTSYVLTATSLTGCGTSTDTVNVKVYNDLYIPNAFTPNGDGLNDIWHIPVLAAFPDAVVTVFDRYGKKIFEGKSESAGWDGTYKGIPQPTGVYVYMLHTGSNGMVVKGTVMLVR